MEIGGNMFGQSNVNRGQNSNNPNIGWDISWELSTSRLDWGGNSSNTLYSTAAAAAAAAAGSSSATREEGSAAHAPFFFHHGDSIGLHGHQQLHYQQEQQASLYGAGDGSQRHPDPHLVCLNLGKRHYFEDAAHLGDRHVARSSSVGKRGKPYTTTTSTTTTSTDNRGSTGGGGPSSSSSSLPATVPRCQVEGCHVPLLNAKDYHRRHKVCEMHSKAPRVVVLGLEQRFCQQCSRFHAVSEFDDSKRSCRRRLAGHNERRRKSAHDSANRNTSQGGGFPYLSSPTGRALSLLSSKTDSWVSPADFSSRSSAALRELIAEHRAGIMAGQLIFDRDRYTENHGMEDLGSAQRRSNSVMPNQLQMFPEQHSWNRYHESDTQLTLDLMQASSSAFGLLSVRGKSKEEEEECSDLWNSFHGAHEI